MYKPTSRAPPLYSEVPTTDPDHTLAELPAQDPNTHYDSPHLSFPPTVDASGQVKPFDASFDPTPANDREAALVRYHIARHEQELHEPQKKPAAIPWSELTALAKLATAIIMVVVVFVGITLFFVTLFGLFTWIRKLAEWLL